MAAPRQMHECTTRELCAKLDGKPHTSLKKSKNDYKTNEIFEGPVVHFFGVGVTPQLEHQ